MEAKSQYGGSKRRYKKQGGSAAKRTKSPARSSVLMRSKEIKSVDPSVSALTFPVNSALAASILNDTTTGVDYFNRVGRKVTGVSLRVRGHFLPPVGSYINDHLRWIIFYDKQPNNAIATWADIVKSQSSVGSSNLVVDGLNMDNRDRFKILREGMFSAPTWNNVTANALGPAYPTSEEMCIDKFISLKGLETMYSSAGLATVQSGAIGIIGQANNGVGWRLNYSARYRFIE